jgi:hypothetical protein
MMFYLCFLIAFTMGPLIILMIIREFLADVIRHRRR